MTHEQACREQVASKDVDFVSFNIVASLQDDINTRESIENLKSDFATYDDYSLIIRRNTDNLRAKFNYSKKSEVETDSAFSSLLDKEVGTVIGP